jgi:hypothetical protein
MESVKPRFAVDAHLRELFATEGKEEPAAHGEPSPPPGEAGTGPAGATGDEMTPTNQVQAPPTAACEPSVVVPVPLPVSLEDAAREDLTRTNEQRHDWTLQVGKPDRGVIRGTYRRMADFVVSTTDPDATVMPDLWGGASSRLPHPLRGRRWQGAHHHGGVGHAESA